jgi:hypothetical protein
MSSLYSSSDVTALLNSLLHNLYRFGGPILIIFGTISSIVTVIVFTQKNLRKNPCSIYFIARNISNLLFIYLSLLYETLALGYNINPSSYNLIYCRFSIYMSFLFDILSPFYLTLTSIDRVFVTSPNASMRKRSTHSLAYTLSITGVIFWMLFHIHTLFFANIIHISPNFFYCYLQLGLYSTLVTYYSLIIKGIVAPVLLTIFGVWTMKNVRNTRLVKIAPDLSIVSNNQYPIQLKDRQIVLILAKDIIIYIVFSSMMSIVFLYELITQYHIRTIEQKEVEHFIRYISTFCVSFPFCISFYTNLIVSKTFRNEVKKIFSFRQVQ